MRPAVALLNSAVINRGPVSTLIYIATPRTCTAKLSIARMQGSTPNRHPTDAVPSYPAEGIHAIKGIKPTELALHTPTGALITPRYPRWSLREAINGAPPALAYATALLRALPGTPVPAPAEGLVTALTYTYTSGTFVIGFTPVITPTPSDRFIASLQATPPLTPRRACATPSDSTRALSYATLVTGANKSATARAVIAYRIFIALARLDAVWSQDATLLGCLRSPIVGAMPSLGSTSCLTSPYPLSTAIIRAFRAFPTHY